MPTTLTPADFYGRGFALPFAFDTETGGVKKRSGMESVEDALINILSTYPSERFMNPAFGSRISAALFELQTEETEALLRAYISEALAFDARLEKVTDVKIEQDDVEPNRLNVTVSVRMKHFLDERNIVIPILRG